MLSIGIPTYDGKIHHATVGGLVQTARFCGEKHVSINMEVIPHDAFIGRARNLIVHKYMMTGFHDLVFVDADIGFNLPALAAICKAAPECVMGLYMMKSPEARYPAMLSDNLIRHPSDRNLVKLKYGPAGFMRIRRSVVEKLMAAYPDDWYLDGAFGKIYDLFPHGRVGNKFTGEDIAFCERCAKADIDIWALQGIALKHYGEKSWDSCWQIDKLVEAGQQPIMGAPDGYVAEVPIVGQQKTQEAA
jgi:hypothetical protein